MFILDLKSVTKDKNTIILPNVDYNKDIEDIKKDCIIMIRKNLLLMVDNT